MLDLTDRGNDKIYPSSLLLSIFMYIFQKYIPLFIEKWYNVCRKAFRLKTKIVNKNLSFCYN